MRVRVRNPHSARFEEVGTVIERVNETWTAVRFADSVALIYYGNLQAA